MGEGEEMHQGDYLLSSFDDESMHTFICINIQKEETFLDKLKLVEIYSAHSSRLRNIIGTSDSIWIHMLLVAADSYLDFYHFPEISLETAKYFFLKGFNEHQRSIQDICEKIIRIFRICDFSNVFKNKEEFKKAFNELENLSDQQKSNIFIAKLRGLFFFKKGLFYEAYDAIELFFKDQEKEIEKLNRTDKIFSNSFKISLEQAQIILSKDGNFEIAQLYLEEARTSKINSNKLLEKYKILQNMLDINQSSLMDNPFKCLTAHLYIILHVLIKKGLRVCFTKKIYEGITQFQHRFKLVIDEIMLFENFIYWPKRSYDVIEKIKHIRPILLSFLEDGKTYLNRLLSPKHFNTMHNVLHISRLYPILFSNLNLHFFVDFFRNFSVDIYAILLYQVEMKLKVLHPQIVGDVIKEVIEKCKGKTFYLFLVLLISKLGPTVLEREVYKSLIFKTISDEINASLPQNKREIYKETERDYFLEILLRLILFNSEYNFELLSHVIVIYHSLYWDFLDHDFFNTLKKNIYDAEFQGLKGFEYVAALLKFISFLMNISGKFDTFSNIANELLRDYLTLEVNYIDNKISLDTIYSLTGKFLVLLTRLNPLILEYENLIIHLIKTSINTPLLKELFLFWILKCMSKLNDIEFKQIFDNLRKLDLYAEDETGKNLFYYVKHTDINSNFMSTLNKITYFISNKLQKQIDFNPNSLEHSEEEKQAQILRRANTNLDQLVDTFNSFHGNRQVNPGRDQPSNPRQVTPSRQFVEPFSFFPSFELSLTVQPSAQHVPAQQESDLHEFLPKSVT